MMECLLAFGVVLLAALVSAIPVAAAWRAKGGQMAMAMAVVASIIIRLLLVTMGVVIIILLFKVRPGWFVGWLAFFYFLTLVFETVVVLSRMSMHSKKAEP
jgi:hypothetical protein